MSKTLSDDKALRISNAAQALGRKVDPQYRNRYDAPRWTEQVEAILARLPNGDIDRLVDLLTYGPAERPEA